MELFAFTFAEMTVLFIVSGIRGMKHYACVLFIANDELCDGCMTRPRRCRRCNAAALARRPQRSRVHARMQMGKYNCAAVSRPRPRPFTRLNAIYFVYNYLTSHKMTLTPRIGDVTLVLNVSRSMKFIFIC